MAPFHMLRMLCPYPDERNVPLWGPGFGYGCRTMERTA